MEKITTTTNRVFQGIGLLSALFLFLITSYTANATYLEGPLAMYIVDTDGDGIADTDDVDDDGDGLTDTTEDANTDGDGDPTTNPTDTDEDGIPDFQDLDSDNDGILDNIEAQNPLAVVLPSGIDADLNGLDDIYEQSPGSGEGLTPVNTDGDAVADYLDQDSDNDGILDQNESSFISTDFDCETVPNLDFSSEPVLESGQGFEVGAVYRIGNISDGLDALITVDQVLNGEIAVLDQNAVDPQFFKPEITFTTTAEIQRPFVDLRIEIVSQGTNDPVVLDELIANFLDVDGNNQYQEYNRFDTPASFTTESPSDVIVNNTSGGLLINGGTEEFDGINNTHPEVNVAVEFVEISSFVFRFGIQTEDTQGFTTNVPRQSGIQFSCLENFVNPVTVNFREDVDTDGDGFPDRLDLESDNDGIPDNVEGQTTADYVPPTGMDDDGDGIDNAYDDGETSGFEPVDTDGDGIPDFIDEDSDNDLVPDSNEGNDFNFDGVPDQMPVGTDSDGDGIDDGYEGGNTIDGFDINDEIDSPAEYFPNTDESEDGNYRDTDDDGDGIETPDEDVNQDGDPTNDDTDGDGTPNYLDPFEDPDTDGDNVPDNVDIDDDNDGLLDTVEDPNTDGDNDPVTNPLDSDQDGLADHVDIDSDNDGIPDNIEGQSTFGYVPPSGQDDDNDGLDNAYEGTGDEGVDPVNTDGTDEPDYLDTDTDNDLVPDNNEGNDFNFDGQPDQAFTGVDTDQDGLDDGYEGSDVNDGFDVNDEIDDPANDLPDTDGTEDVNYRDLDDDGDGTDTPFEDANDDGDPTNDDTDEDGTPDYLDPDSGMVPDTDGDGVPDNVDIDDDNDGILDTVEDPNFDGDDDPLTEPQDSDGDGFADHLDIDSDNDGIPDNVEGQTTSGYIAPTGLDEDSDGLDNAYEGSGNEGVSPVNTDGEDQPDYLDSDTDNDLVADNNEGNDFNFDGQPDQFLSGVDTDGDGLDDGFEGTDIDDGFDVNDEIDDPANDLPDTDGTEDVNYRDIDDDGDGINTPDEDADGDGDPTNDDTDGDGTPDYLDPIDDRTDEAEIEVNQMITPNGDGRNDFLFIRGVERTLSNKLRIYNRWGVEVYIGDDYNNQNNVFDGRSRGRSTLSVNDFLPSGVYYYIFDYETEVQSKTASGFIFISK